MVAERRGALGEEAAGIHGRVGRHHELVPPRSLGQRRCRHGGDVALHAEPALDLVVEGCEIVVGHGPVGDVGPRHRPGEAQAGEVLLPHARRLAIPVDRAAPDGRREGVHVADERPGHPLVRLGLGARRPWLEHDVLVLEVAARLHLVVAEQ